MSVCSHYFVPNYGEPAVLPASAADGFILYEGRCGGGGGVVGQQSSNLDGPGRNHNAKHIAATGAVRCRRVAAVAIPTRRPRRGIWENFMNLLLLESNYYMGASHHRSAFPHTQLTAGNVLRSSKLRSWYVYEFMRL